MDKSRLRWRVKHSGGARIEPAIELTRLPPAGEGSPDKVYPIAGKVAGGMAGDRVVLFARSGEAVTAVLEDREGNVWIGGSGSIERLLDSAFVTYTASEGLPSDRNGRCLPMRTTAFGLRRARAEPGGLGSDVVYSFTGAGVELWIGRQRGGLTRLRREGGKYRAQTINQADGLAQNSVYAVHLGGDGSVWAGTLSGGVSKLSGVVFKAFSTADGLPSNSITAIAEDARGTMWLGTPNGLASYSKGAWRTFRTGDGLPAEKVHSLLQDSSGVLWVGTSKGLSFYADGALHSVANAAGPLGEPVFGLAEDSKGDLWVATSGWRPPSTCCGLRERSWWAAAPGSRMSVSTALRTDCTASMACRATAPLFPIAAGAFGFRWMRGFRWPIWAG